MDRHDGFGATCYGRFNSLRIDVTSPDVGFYGNRRGLGIRNSKPGCNVGVRWHDDLVAFPNIVGSKNEVQSLQTVPNTNAMLDATIGSELVFERLDLFAKDVPGRTHKTK